MWNILIFIIAFLVKYRSNADETWPTHATECRQHFRQIWSNSKSSSKTWTFRDPRPSGGEISTTDFSTRFSLITREPNTLQTCKLSQKIPFAILRRMEYSLTPKNA